MNRKPSFYEVALAEMNDQISNKLSALNDLGWQEIAAVIPEVTHQTIELNLESLFGAKSVPGLNALAQIDVALGKILNEYKLAQQPDVDSETEPDEDYWRNESEERDAREYL